MSSLVQVNIFELEPPSHVKAIRLHWFYYVANFYAFFPIALAHALKIIPYSLAMSLLV